MTNPVHIMVIPSLSAQAGGASLFFLWLAQSRDLSSIDPRKKI